MKTGDVYKDFVVLDVFDVSYRSSQAVYLRHKRCGLEVFHLLNTDEENLFAFAFRTPPENSTGAAHIMEHSVFCGSKRFPQKDPFLQLKKQSVSTYLNAYTAKDRTVFPASSPVRADYFALMAVYADAVFFPLLRRETFLQEGWRLEKGADGEPCIQGVVFNEMKGNYSSFNSSVTDAVGNAGVLAQEYKNDSGGDPLEIPKLSFEEFRRFHRRYYCAANCLVFLYGNIPTEQQLDFLDENVVSRLKTRGRKYVFHQPSPAPEKQDAQEAEDTIEVQGAAEASPPVSAVVWRIGGSAERENLFVLPMEINFLSELLFGNDSSPVLKALLKRFPGCDASPQTGCTIHSRFFSAAVALTGIGKERVHEFSRTVDEALADVLENGIPPEDIERSLMSFDFSIREVKRSPTRGPYSLVLMKWALRAWTYGKNPRQTVLYAESFDDIKRKIEADPAFLMSRIRAFFVDNRQRSVVTVTPSKEWSEKREASEKLLASRLFDAAGEQKTQESLKRMHRFQARAQDERLFFMPADRGSSALAGKRHLVNTAEKITTKRTLVEGIPFFSNEESTNGIVYASLSFPVDRLKPADYKFLPLLCACIPDIGTKKNSWERTLSVADRISGNFGSYIRCAKVPENRTRKITKDPLIVGREWLSVHFKFFEHKTSEVFAFLAEVIGEVNFGDTDRLATILNGLVSNMNSSIVPNGHFYATLRSCRTLNRACAVHEIKDGLSAVFASRQIQKMPIEDVSKKLKSIYKKITSSGAIFHVTSQKSGIDYCKRQIPLLTRRLKLSFPKEKAHASDEQFIRLTELPSTAHLIGEACVADEVVLIPGSTAFCAATVSSSGSDDKKIMADTVFAHLSQTAALWSKIRTEGGAYGVFLSVKSSSAVTCFCTYRDPKPFDSLQFFLQQFLHEQREALSEEEIERAVAGVYSDEIEPYVPSTRGGTGLMRKLYGGSPDSDRKRIDALLSLEKVDVEKAAERYAKSSVIGRKVVICSQDIISGCEKKCGKIVSVLL